MAELAVIGNSFDEIARIGKAFSASGYFSDAKDVAQAIVKVMAGREMGFGPFASMTGIHVIKGKPSIGANLMAAAVKGHPRYDYRVRKMGADEVALEFFEGGESLGTSVFTKQDATKAGTQNIDKFPRNMLFARAMSNGVKWYCPDIFAGNAVYTPEELGADVDDNGDIIDASVVREVAQPEPTAEEQEPHALSSGLGVWGGGEGHWIDRDDVRKRFWMWVRGELELSEEQAHEALGVEHVRDYAGTMDQAKAALEEYAAKRDAYAAADEDTEPIKYAADDPKRPFTE